jgi:hypothetical protein
MKKGVPLSEIARLCDYGKRAYSIHDRVGYSHATLQLSVKLHIQDTPALQNFARVSPR